ncbi:MAG: aldehyde ferredoxin oxidoreductase family protein [Deltaproteobacteria bacterium]|nr:aldehyde ferredoxin oxidoreductase family protein [Deltaproteobacteria bacterium]
MSGYHHKLLRVDLNRREIKTQDLDPQLTDSLMGGAGVAAKLLYDETTADTEPLSPDNVFIAMTGPFTGTRVPSAGRHHIVARSPLTGIFGEANVGGSWGVMLKKAGYDGVVVTGKADKPVYVAISDDKVEIRDAGEIWGQDAEESAKWLKSQTSNKAAAAVIGQAGERLAPIAGVPHIGTLTRAAARTGLGAVLGSKNLKAMVAVGKGQAPVADPEGLEKSVKGLLKHITEATETFGQYGTGGGAENYEKAGNFPLKNWKQGRWEGVSKINGVVLHDTVLTGRKGCWRCPIACGRHIKITEGPYAGLEGAGPEYETMGTMGGECLVDDLAAICKANDLCNRYGLDTISAGATVAFAMEAYEKGLITTEDTGGVELTWGNAEALVKMVDKMGKREGIGELMSQGSAAMAEALGHNASEFAVHVKGLEPSAHDPRRFFSQALSYGTAGRGACHNASWSHPYELALTMSEIGIDEPQDAYQVDGKAAFTATLQNLMCVQDSALLCRFTQIGKAVTVENVVEWMSLITGKQWDVESLMKVGERVFTLKRLYNTRLGVSRKDDFLPPRFMTLNREGEELTNQLPPIGRLLSDYYKHRGWSEEGIPTQQTLAKLGIA